MPKAISALQGVEFKGFARVSDMGPQGMITLRGDLSAKAFQAGVTKVSGTNFPKQGGIAEKGERALAWMSPDELLLLCPYGEVSTTIGALTEALDGAHHLIANVSDARARISVTNGHAREVLAKLTPANLSPDAFGPGLFRRSRLAQVPAAFWIDGDDNFHVICFRSVAQYVFDILKTAAMPGSEVEYFDE